MYQIYIINTRKIKKFKNFQKKDLTNNYKSNIIACVKSKSNLKIAYNYKNNKRGVKNEN